MAMTQLWPGALTTTTAAGEDGLETVVTACRCWDGASRAPPNVLFFRMECDTGKLSQLPKPTRPCRMQVMRGVQASACPAGTKADRNTVANGQLLQVGGGADAGRMGSRAADLKHPVHSPTF